MSQAIDKYTEDTSCLAWTRIAFTACSGSHKKQEELLPALLDFCPEAWYQDTFLAKKPNDCVRQHLQHPQMQLVREVKAQNTKAPNFIEEPILPCTLLPDQVSLIWHWSLSQFLLPMNLLFPLSVPFKRDQ